MPTFPDTKNDILILAAKVAAGITDYPADYPDPPFDAPAPSPLVLEATSTLRISPHAKKFDRATRDKKYKE